MKETYYFKHDQNAKDDYKCIALIEELGLEGYGIFWVLIETLRQQPDYKYPLKLLGALARRYNTSNEKMKAVVTRYDLFTVFDGDKFGSESLIRRMQDVDYLRISGIKGNLIKYGHSTKDELSQMSDSEIVELNNSIKSRPRLAPDSDAGRKKRKEKKIKSNKRTKEVFEIFRKSYSGTKRGEKIEFDNFEAKCRKFKLDQNEVVDLLMPALEVEKEWREQALKTKTFAPDWSHLSTWINQQRWTQELKIIDSSTQTEDELLNDAELPPELESNYQKYVSYVEEKLPALAKSKCRILSKSEYLIYKREDDFKARARFFQVDQYFDFFIKVHEEMNKKRWLLNDEPTVYGYFKTKIKEFLKRETA